LAEFDFRYNHRASLGYSDEGRTIAAVRAREGKRLTYHHLVKRDLSFFGEAVSALAEEEAPLVRRNFRDSPSMVGISFSGVGRPLKAPCEVFRKRCSVSWYCIDSHLYRHLAAGMMGFKPMFPGRQPGVLPLDDMADTVPPKLTKMNRRHEYDRRLDRLGFQGCIYCNEPQESPLTIEHIIPEALGGALTIPNASCDKCSDETHAFEGHAMNMTRAFRRQLGFPQKHRGAKARALRGEERFVLMLDDKKVKVPIEEFPALLLSLVFPLPGILLNQTPEDKPLSGGVYSAELAEGFGEKLNRIRKKYRASRIAIMGIEPTKRHGDEGDFGRMLAKIAHAYAVAELGWGNFRPFLTNIIRGIRPYNLPYFIGSPLGKTPPYTDLHQLEIDQGALSVGKFIVVKIRLFANRDTPTHYVVVGEKINP
jgi:HNH endonuclease